MDAAAGLLAGDPPGSAGAGGDLAVRGHGVFQDDIGTAGLDVMEKYLVECVALGLQYAGFHLDTGLAENLQPLSRHQGIGVIAAHHHPGDARLQNGVGAGGLAAVVAAGLQGNVQCCTGG